MLSREFLWQIRGKTLATDHSETYSDWKKKESGAFQGWNTACSSVTVAWAPAASVAAQLELLAKAPCPHQAPQTLPLDPKSRRQRALRAQHFQSPAVITANWISANSKLAPDWIQNFCLVNYNSPENSCFPQTKWLTISSPVRPLASLRQETWKSLLPGRFLVKFQRAQAKISRRGGHEKTTQDGRKCLQIC